MVKGFLRANNNNHNALLQYKQKRRSKTVPFVLTYNPAFTKFQRLIRGDWHIIAKPPK